MTRLNPSLIRRAEEIWQRLDDYCRQHDYAGRDPFDGLNSPYARNLKGPEHRSSRLLWVQFFKRSPFDFRGMAKIPQVRNSKADALFALSYFQKGQTKDVKSILKSLLARQCGDPWPQGCWSYPFDWQSRAFFVDKSTPNLIATAYALRAVHAGDPKTFRKLAKSVAHFIEHHLMCFNSARRGVYFSYVPDNVTMVHNVNVWAVYILLLASREGAGEHYKDLALKALDYTLKAQRPDGSWFYGEALHHSFVDSFHTGFILEALDLIIKLHPSKTAKAALKTGLAYYRETFFGAKGEPHYYDYQSYPYDVHSAAQAILTLLKVRPDAGSVKLAEKVLGWTLDHLWLPEKGYFAYQQRRFYTNRIPYMRWSQAWMHLALSTYLAYPHND